MKAIIKPGNIQGVITAPPSKSMTQRAYAAGLLHYGTTIINNPGCSEDEQAAREIIQQLGAEVFDTIDNTTEIITRGIQPLTDTIHCGESGLSARLFIPVAALSDTGITITGKGSLLNRPMTEYLDVLPQLGVSILETNTHLPLSVRGPLQPKDITLDGSVSSQFLTGLLMVFAFTARHPVTIQVTGLASRPYIDLTLEVLELFGKQVVNDNYQSFTIDPSLHTETTEVYVNIEGDWSAAANFIVAQAMGNNVLIKGLYGNSVQADTAIAQIVNDDQPFIADVTHCPDLFPILSVYAGYCKGRSEIKGLHRLIYKESNRMESIKAMLHSFGIDFTIIDDTLLVAGGNTFKSCTVESYNDHRIAMAAAIAASVADGPVIINRAEAVSKSYPAFFNTLSSCGVDCQLVN